MNISNAFKVGDVVSFGEHWSVPTELVGKFWRVKAIEGGAVALDGPYVDGQCVERYHPKPPDLARLHMRAAGRGGKRVPITPSVASS